MTENLSEMSTDEREHRKVIIEPLWATDENETENRWVREKNRERTKTNNCALVSRDSSSDHVPSPRPPTTVYILLFTNKRFERKNFKLSHSVTFYIWRSVRNNEQSLSPLRDSGATKIRQSS